MGSSLRTSTVGREPYLMVKGTKHFRKMVNLALASDARINEYVDNTFVAAVFADAVRFFDCYNGLIIKNKTLPQIFEEYQNIFDVKEMYDKIRGKNDTLRNYIILGQIYQKQTCINYNLWDNKNLHKKIMRKIEKSRTTSL